MRPIFRATLYPTEIHPALRSFADECTGVLARLIAYVGALALIVILGIGFWDALELRASSAPATHRWSARERSPPDSPAKTAVYEANRAGYPVDRSVSLIGLRGGL